MGPQRAAGGMQALLGSIVADPDAAVERLSIVEAPERSILLDAFNATDLAPSDLMHAEQTVHGLLEHWARVTPDKPAALFEVRLSSCCAIQHMQQTARHLESLFMPAAGRPHAVA